MDSFPGFIHSLPFERGIYTNTYGNGSMRRFSIVNEAAAKANRMARRKGAIWLQLVIFIMI